MPEPITTALVIELMRAQVLHEVVDAAKHTGKQELARLSPTAQLEAAIAESNEEVLLGISAIVIEFAKVALGQVWGFDHAKDWLIGFARDRKTHACFRALWSRAVQEADDERAAMLAAIHLAASPTLMRDRICLAVGGLFPEDVRVLSTLIQAAREHGDGRRFLVGLEEIQDEERAPWELELTMDADDERALLDIRVPKMSMLALDGARCIRLRNGVRNAEQTRTVYGTELLELGYALNEVAKAIDWTKVARQRRAGVLG